MTLHQLFALCTRRITVEDDGAMWELTPYSCTPHTLLYHTRAEAHKAAAPYRVLLCLTHTYPRRGVEALRAVAERHTRNGGDWRDCARAAINSLKKEHTMSKVLIDRALLERVQERLDPHRDAVLWGAVCDTFHTAPSGTPAMPVKAYYHEWTDLEGVRTRSVGLEVRKEFADAPLVLEADALARIACLEGEIAKRDEELAACRVAVENCDLFRARIAELEADRDRLKRMADNYSALNMDAQAELAAIKAQELAESDYYRSMLRAVLKDIRDEIPRGGLPQSWNDIADSISASLHRPLYAAPVSEAKAQGVVQWPEADEIMQMAFEEGQPADDASGYCFELEEFDLFIERLMSEVARLNAAPVQQVSVPDGWKLVPVEPTPEMLAATTASKHEGLRAEVMRMAAEDYRAMLNAAPAAPAADAGLVEALEKIAAIPSSGSLNYHPSYMSRIARAALAAHRAKGVV